MNSIIHSSCANSARCQTRAVASKDQAASSTHGTTPRSSTSAAACAPSRARRASSMWCVPSPARPCARRPRTNHRVADPQRFSDGVHCTRFVAALGHVLARAWHIPLTPASLCMSASPPSTTTRPIPIPIAAHAHAPAEAPRARAPPRARALGGGTPVVSVYIPHPLERFAPSTTSPDLKSVLNALAAEPVQLRIRGACGPWEAHGLGCVGSADALGDFGERGEGEDGDGDGSFYEDTASFSAVHDVSSVQVEPEEPILAPRARAAARRLGSGLGFSDAMHSSGAEPAPTSVSPPRQTLDLVALSVSLVSATAGRSSDTVAPKAVNETQAKTMTMTATKTTTKTKAEDKPKPGATTGARSSGETDAGADADTTDVDVDASMAAQLATALALLGALEPQSPSGPPPALCAHAVESVASASTPDRPAQARTVQPPPPRRPASHSQLPSQPPPQVKAHARQARAQRHSAAAAVEPVKLRKMGSWVSGLFGEIQNLKGRERAGAGGGAVRVDGDKARG
ncbi:hypothetical protein HETIRDRAFT_311944 [Heterobasidion irregulare TC 32-1]|uniref:Uncharacterized protein n=1 Tax=Heterobasidion irregulare (strain TC 32-1) TaxID=747525 RepID=W4KH67_HETIT|nr:uncharacterized protein HETIRDRAFT_311944 [Heterobasidion irregulare TC 32-1]ETW84670.1 hypothetical protein HETIRDRAFT_311944 [Heterobasidion irregulare TC 32-1]